MITYRAAYEQNKAPSLLKVVSIGPESIETKLTPQSERTELDSIPLSTLYEHLNNYISFLKDRVDILEVYSLDDPALDGAYPFKNYKDIDDVLYVSSEWWRYIYTSREPEEETPA